MRGDLVIGIDSSTTAAASAGWCVHPPDGVAVCGEWYSTNLGIGVGARDGVMPPWSAEFDLAFTWGASFGVGFGLSAHAEIVDLSNGRAQADFSLLHSAAWGGVISVTDAEGNPIAPGAYQLLSASGADYSGPIAAAVPEVPAFLMLSSGALLLLARHRRGVPRPVDRAGYGASAAASRARVVIRCQSAAATASRGVSHEPPTQATLA